jgi:hypothetical protein
VAVTWSRINASVTGRGERERERERENEFGSPGLRNVAVERAI